MKNWWTSRRGASGVAVLAIAAIGLSGCSSLKSDGIDPIEWYRDASGSSQNDEKDQARDSKNLAEGSDEPYPNLATVPPPPDVAMSKIDRDKLAKDLIADRQNAKYTDEQLAAGQKASTVPLPERAVAEEQPAPPASASGSEKPATANAAPPTPRPTAENVPPPTAAASAPAPSPQSVSTTTLSKPSAKPKPTPPRTAMNPPSPASDTASTAAPAKPAATTRVPKRGAEAPPQESAMTPPSPRPMPQGDTLRQAPPSPVAAPSGQKVATADPGAAVVASPRPQPGRNAVSVQAAEIRFSPGPFRGKILPSDRSQLAQVAQLAKQNNARVRVVGYGGAAAGGDLTQREFQSFDAALDNAKAVAVALTTMGVPPGTIDVETVAQVNARDRAEVFVEY